MVGRISVLIVLVIVRCVLFWLAAPKGSNDIGRE